MTEPEQALERARAAAAERRAAGEYAADVQAVDPLPDEAVSFARLYEWALIEPDLRDVRSTRRYGRPMTALKHGLLRLLAQYHAALIAEQTRFNVNLLVYLKRLEDRIDALEQGPGEPPQ